jgi:hypothetical protein
LLPVSAFALSQLISPRFSLTDFRLDEDHVRTLATTGRPDVAFLHCSFTDAGADALLDSLRHNRGPTSLFNFEISVVITV